MFYSLVVDIRLYGPRRRPLLGAPYFWAKSEEKCTSDENGAPFKQPHEIERAPSAYLAVRRPYCKRKI